MKLLIQILVCLILSVATNAQDKYYVLFDYDKDEVPDTAMAQLIKTIYTNNVARIYLEGHCDSIGSRTYNYDLSQRRVKSVEQLLVDNGFDKFKIRGRIGFGKDKPVTANNTAAARQKNRRVLVQFEFGAPIPTKPKPQKEKEIPVVAKEEPQKKLLQPKTPSNKRIIKKQLTPAQRPLALKIENFKPNALIALPNLVFQGGRHFLMNRSTASLDSLVRILKEKSDLRVEIQGHVCCTTYQLDGYDWDTRTDNLSVTRAFAIKRYLIKQGIAANRLQTRGFGGTRKLFPKEENKYQIENNRRVEIMVLP